MKNIIASPMESGFSTIVILLTFSIVANATPVFTISGTITDSSNNAIPETYEITVENQTRALSQTGTINKSAPIRKYTVIFVTMETDDIVAAVGDKLQISVKDGDNIVTSQSYTITETDIANANATINIQIPLKPTEIQSINITPETVAVVACQTQQFTVSVASSLSGDSSDLPVASSLSGDSVTWEVIGDIGEIDNNGLFTAKKPGDGKIKATLKSNPEITAETGSINVTRGDADKVELTANPTEVHPGERSTLTIKVTDACGNPVPNEKVEFLLEGTGDLGQVVDNGDGTYTAEYTAGDAAGKVLIMAFIGAKSDSVGLSVVDVATLVVNAGEDKTIRHPKSGGTTQIGGAQTASGGMPLYSYSWTPTTGLDDATVANPTATPTATTTYTITVTDSGEPPQEASDSVTVNVDDTPPNPPEIQISSTSGDTVTMSKATITVKGSGESGASIQSATLHELQNNSIRDSTDVKDYVSIDNGNISGSFDVGELADVDEIQLVIILSDIFNYSEPGRSNKLKVDKENPIVALEQPGSGSYFNTVPVILSGTAFDDTGVVRVEVDTGEGFLVAEGTNEWHYSFEPKKDGKYTVTVRAFDGVNRSSENAECTFSYFSYLPTAAISYPLDGAELTGRVDILGSAGARSHPENREDVNEDLRDFSYTLEYAEGVNPSEGFIKVTTVEGKPVQNGKLGEWDVSGLVEGVYTLRLTVKTGDETVGVTRNNLMVKGHKMVTLKLNLAKGWNLISFPGNVITPSPKGFLENELVDGIFFEDAEGNLVDMKENLPSAFELDTGYWVLAKQDVEIDVQLIPQEQYTRSVKRGWNLIGSVYGEAPVPGDLLQLNRWNTKEKVYERVLLIEEGIGYLALAIQDSEITVETKPPEKPTAPPLTPDPSPLFQLPLWVNCPNRPPASLVIGIHPDAKSGFDSIFDMALPPPSPGGKLPHAALLLDGDFPLRLSKKILPVPKSGASKFVLQVADEASDAVLSWDAKQIPDDWSLMLIDKTKQIDMRQQSTYSPPKGEREIVLSINCLPSKQELPQSTVLLQNFPNPFNPETWIPFRLSENAEVVIKIYDLKGELVRMLRLGNRKAGRYLSSERAAHWDGRNAQGEKVASGLYFYVMEAGDFRAIRRMMVLK